MELLQVLDWVTSSQCPLRSHVDESKIVTAGHSKGGKLAFSLAAFDDRVDHVVAWDPSNSGGPPCGIASVTPGLDCDRFPVAPNCAADEPGLLHFIRAETLVLGMPRDEWMNPDAHHNSIHFFRGAPSPASFVQIDHEHQAPRNDPEVIALNKRVHMAVLLTRFKGHTGLEHHAPWSSEGRAELQHEALVIRVENK